MLACPNLCPSHMLADDSYTKHAWTSSEPSMWQAVWSGFTGMSRPCMANLSDGLQAMMDSRSLAHLEAMISVYMPYMVTSYN
jgi:hypothetical protein